MDYKKKARMMVFLRDKFPTDAELMAVVKILNLNPAFINFTGKAVNTVSSIMVETERFGENHRMIEFMRFIGFTEEL